MVAFGSAAVTPGFLISAKFALRHGERQPVALGLLLTFATFLEKVIFFQKG